MTVKRNLTAMVAAILLLGSTSAGWAAEIAEVAATLNGLKITFDGRSGAIRRLEYPGPGTLVDAEASQAGLVDAAYPVPELEPLRLAARPSSGATIEKGDARVVVRLGKLGPSRGNFKLEGEVAATVTLRADPDGRSIVLS